MFSFLNSSLLWALPLAAAPVVFHLILLRRATRVPFGDLTLLRAAYARSLPSTRLRQWLILLVRCLAIALLVLAFSRPVFHRRALGPAGVEQGIDLVVLADVSWSMGAEVRGKPRLEWAVAAGKRLVDFLRPADRVAVASFSDALETPLAWAASRNEAQEALTRLRPGHRPTDIGPALTEAFTLLGKSGPRRRRLIAVLSDNAAHLLHRLPASGIPGLPGYDPEVLLLGLSWEEFVGNAGIHAVEPLRGGERAGLTARPALYADAGRTGWSLDMILRDRRWEQRSLELTPGTGRALTFQLPVSRGAERWGRFQLRADALAADDVYYFALRVQPRPRVLLLYGNPSYLEAGRGGYFLKKLMGDGGTLPYRLDLADLGRLKQIQLEEYGAVILADFRDLPPRIAESLKRYVLRGGGLWVIAGTQADHDTYRDLRGLLPGRLGPGGLFARSLSLRPEVGAIPADLRRDFRWEEFELNRVAISRGYPLELAEGSSVWFRDSAGRPLLAAGVFGHGRVLLFASALDLRWSNLALKPAFTAWIDIGLRHLTRYSGREQWKTLHVGEPIVRTWGAAEAVPAKVQVRGPGGLRTTLLVRGRSVTFSDTRVPGLYFLQPVGGGGRGGVEAFAVNLDRAGPEGDLRPAHRLPWTPLRPQHLRADFLRAVYGREIRTWVLACVALLLLLEAILVRPRRRPEGAGPGRAQVRVEAAL